MFACPRLFGVNARNLKLQIHTQPGLRFQAIGPMDYTEAINSGGLCKECPSLLSREHVREWRTFMEANGYVW